ncbi:MAG: DUF547 domain-containing protein [Thermoguttaceae bacterium]
MRKLVLVTAAAILGLGSVAYVACSGQNREVVVDGRAGSQTSKAGSHVPLDQVDHTVWDRLLKKYVDQDGMVNYAAWKASETDHAALKAYLAALGQADQDAKTTKDGELAFWINAYNALTVHGILEVYPTSSIRNHTAKVLGYNIWKDLLLPVGDKKYSLDAIEHEVLRKLGEPRIHFAIVCASIGCPRLRNEAYTPAKLEAQLADNTRDFLGRPKNLQIDLANRRVQVSSILDWFGKDFAPTSRKALASLAEYMPDEATRHLIASEDFSVSYLDYDWSLNKQ